jgi:hypothetical protein
MMSVSDLMQYRKMDYGQHFYRNRIYMTMEPVDVDYNAHHLIIVYDINFN